MKIGVMLRHLEHQRGGIGTYTRQILEHLLKIDKQNHYFLLYSNENAIGKYVKYPNVKELAVRSSSSFLWDQMVVPKVAKINKLDLIFNPKLSVPLLSPCKSVFVMHGADWFVFPQNYKLLDQIYHKIFAPLYCKRADTIVSVSDDATKKIIEKIRISAKKLKTIYHGVDSIFHPINNTSYLEEIRNKYHLPERFMLFIGQIYPMKNVTRIIMAFSQLRQHIPHKLVIVGKPALKYKHELSLIDKYNLQEDVVLTGWIPDSELPAFYNLAELFIFPSLYEGFGLPLLEAMACGCPVVTSQTGSPPEVVGEAAYLVNPRDVMSISQGIYDVLTDELLRQNLIEKGYRRAQQFSWHKCAQETLAVFEGLLTGC